MTERPNILVITFDCLRPDHLGGLGYRGTRTPTFDRYIDEGTTFLNAYCQAPNTWISHASLFTGCNPYLHGVRTPLRKIFGELHVMAEVFKAAGYATFGLPAMSLLGEKAGFSRGFDEYRLDGLQSEEKILDHRYYRSASDTLNLSIDWLKRSSRPSFAWIHYFGVHKLEEKLFDMPDHYRRSYSPYAQFYDGKVALADEGFLAPLTHELARLGLLDDTVVVLWSDHGENLHAVEHGLYWGHNWDLNEDVMRTVLIMRGPGLPSGQIHREVAQSIDILPTLLALAGLPPLPQCEGRSLVVHEPSTEQTVYMENLCQGFVAVRRGDFKLVLSKEPIEETHESKLAWRLALLRETMGRLLPARLSRLTQTTRSDLATWCRVRGEPEETLERLLERGWCSLYSLSEHADQHTNLAAAEPHVVAELKLLLQEMASRTVTGLDMVMTDEEHQEVEERLKALGYM